MCIRDSPQKMKEEWGDLVFALVNLARHLNIQAEEALQGANNRFAERFGFIERKIKEQGDVYKRQYQLRLCTLKGIEQLLAILKSHSLKTRILQGINYQFADTLVILNIIDHVIAPCAHLLRCV